MKKQCGLAVLIVCGFLASGLAQQRKGGTAPTSKTSPEAAATAVVFNNRDPVSVQLAGYYADRRGIPLNHLIGLDCSVNEDVTREEYDRTIAEPLRKIFRERGWWEVAPGQFPPVSQSKIRYVALVRGIPLKIAATTNYPGDSFSGLPALNRNEACVDSELAILGLSLRMISGPSGNPYYRSFTRFMETKLAPMMLVCRLDGPSAPIVRRMIDDSLDAEQRGLWGFAYVDSRGLTGGDLIEGDQWLRRLADLARKHGVPVIEDRVEAQFDADYPMRNAALYFGWYSENVEGPISREDFRFNKGAIACHIHSNSATTIRDAHQRWVAPLLAHGAAAAMGNVFEPYLSLTPNLDIFYERLCNGFNFAESAYASMRGLSWMNTFVGDPLYRPFKVVPDDANNKGAAEWIAYREGALEWFDHSRASGEKKLRESAQRLHSGIIFEGLGLLENDAAGDPTSALAAFDQAQGCYRNVDDVIRILIHRVRMYQALNRPNDALMLARKAINAFPTQPAANVLRHMEAALAPPPAPSSPKP